MMRGSRNSDNFEQFSDVGGNSRSVSDTSEKTDVTSDSKCSSYTDTMSTCSACMLLSPHSQLFVCTKNSCGYSLQQKVPIMAPSLFYTREKVFCGSCAFRGVHSLHKKYMRSAEQLAFKTASGEVGTKLELKLEKFAEMTDETPVDYFVMQMNGNKNLPKIPVVEYLSASEDINEWHSRLAILSDAVRTLNECCLQGHAFVKEQAEKLLTAYSYTSQLLEHDLITKNQERAEINNNRHAEHHLRMGIRLCRDDDEQSSFSSISSCSRKSSICSTSSTETVRQIPPKKEVPENNDQAVGGSAATGIMEETVKNSEFADETVRQTIIIVGRKLEMLRRTCSADESTQQIVNFLDSRIQCINHKQEVINQIEKTYSITWPRKLQ